MTLRGEFFDFESMIPILKEIISSFVICILCQYKQ